MSLQCSPPVNGCHPCPALERFAFFRVSKLTHRRPERQCNPARYPKPRKNANRSCGKGADGNRSQEGDISFHFHHSAPCFLKAFDMGDVLPPLHSPYAALKANAVSPTAKAGKTTGLPLNCSKKYPLPVNGCRPCSAAGAVCLLQGFDRGPNCTGSGKGNELALKPGKRQTAPRRDITGS